MSIKSRARSLSKKLEISYQSALALLRKLEAKPAEIARQHRWPLTRADAYAIDPVHDDEYGRVAATGFDVKTHACDECLAAHFYAEDETGIVVAGDIEMCPACIAQEPADHAAASEHDVTSLRQRPTIEIEPRALRQMRKLDDLINPPWARRMKRLQDLVDPPALRGTRNLENSFGRFASASKLAAGPDFATDKHLAAGMSLGGLEKTSGFEPESLEKRLAGLDMNLIGKFVAGEIHELPNGINASLKALRGPLAETPLRNSILAKDFTGTSKLSTWMLDLGRAEGTAAALDTFLSPFRTLNERIHPSLSESAWSAWTKNLSGTAAAWARLGISDRFHRMGLLSVDEAHDTAALVWRGQKQQEELAAAWLRDDDSRHAAPVTATIDVVCSVCSTVLISAEETFDWKGPKNGVFRVGVFPACTQCIRESHDDPEYWERILNDGKALAPALRIVPGTGRSDGVPRGALQLVTERSNAEGTTDDDGSGSNHET